MKDPRTEAFLDRGQWHWTYVPKVPFIDIDIAYSAENPARLHRKIDDDRVMQYAEEMEAGIEFPAIVLVTPSVRDRVTYDVATGMHRLNAADMAQSKLPKHIDAYVVTEPDRYRREVLSLQLNTIEGKGDTQHDQVMHVIRLHQEYNRSLVALCKEWHLKEHSVRTQMRAVHARKRAREVADIELGKTRLSVTAQGTLHGSIQSDRVFKEAVTFIYNHRPGPAVIDDLCKAAREHQRDEAKCLEVVRQYVQSAKERQDREKAKTARTHTGPAQAMISNAGRFNKQVSRGIDQLFLNSLTNSDKQKARAVIDDMVINAKRILTELDRIDRINERVSRHLVPIPTHSDVLEPVQ